MKWSFFIAFSCLLMTASGQYYYYDILAAHQTQLQNSLLKKNQITKVSAASFESDNSANSNFRLEQKIENNASLIITNSTDAAGINTVTTSNFSNGKIKRNTDSTSNVVTTTKYSYDNTGKLLSVETVSADAFMNSRSEEMHLWYYTGDKPSTMLKIKDKRDTTRVEFVYDEKGNLAEETWKKGNYMLEHWYYYYDANNQVSDIVRFNAKAKRMLPDFLFEYDQKGRITQMTQVSPGTSSYLVWQYQFDERGLKKTELCYNKQKQLVGKVVYVYQ